MTDHHTITDRDTQPGTLTDARASLPGRVDTGRVDTERSCPVCGTCFTLMFRSYAAAAAQARA